jgi:hypothetical protein
MNRSLHGLLILGVLAVVGSQVLAQTTITADDISAQYAVGRVTTRYFDTTSTAQVNIGDTGATSWDFSHLLRDSSLTTTAVQPSANQFPNEFPGATHAIKSALTLTLAFGGSQITASGTAYEGYKLDSYFVDFGIKGSGLLNNSIPGTVVWTKVPPDTVYKLPVTKGTEWGSSDSAITIIDVPQFFGYHTRTALYESSNNIVDAYGSMALPDTTVHQALRIRKTSRTSGAVSYTFVARDGAFVNVTAVNPASPINGTIAVKGISWGGAIFNPPTGIASSPNVPLEFSLGQNYPNPFNPSTVIRYGLPQQSHVLLDVYNVIGQKVATLVNENQQAGFHEVHFNGTSLPSGLYFYRLTSGGFVQTLKMVLTK